MKSRFALAPAILLGATLLLSGTVGARTTTGPLVTTTWPAANLDKVVVLDVRTVPASFEKKEARTAAAVNPCGVMKKQPADHQGTIQKQVVQLEPPLLGTLRFAQPTVCRLFLNHY